MSDGESFWLDGKQDKEERTIAPREIPDYAEPILAYRFWNVSNDRLVSTRGFTWWKTEAINGPPQRAQRGAGRQRVL
jgi:hypothetical protein